MPIPFIGWAAAAVGAAVVGYAMSDSDSSRSDNSEALKREAKGKNREEIINELDSYLENSVAMFESKYQEKLEVDLNAKSKYLIKISYKSLEKPKKQLTSLEKENSDLNGLKKKLEALRIQI